MLRLRIDLMRIMTHMFEKNQQQTNSDFSKQQLKIEQVKALSTPLKIKNK